MKRQLSLDELLGFWNNYLFVIPSAISNAVAALRHK